MSYSSDMLLGQFLVDHEVWDEFVQAFREFLAAEIDPYIEQLAELRDVRPDTDKTQMLHILHLLGFSLDDQVLNEFDQQDLFVFLQDFPRYAEFSGTNKLALFLTRVLRSPVSIQELWTNNYQDFYPALPVGERTLEQGGHWFLTTHVDVDFDWASLEHLDPGDGRSLRKRVYDIFYQFAPINLVLRSVGTSPIFEIEPQCVCANLSAKVVIQYL